MSAAPLAPPSHTLPPPIQVNTKPSWVSLFEERKDITNISDEVIASDFLSNDTHFIHSSTVAGKYEQFDLFQAEDGKSVYGLIRFGMNMCGHTGLIHGGCIATVIDEICGWTFGMNKLGIGFTANLNVNYRKPIPVHSTVLVHCTIESVEGRKVFLKCLVIDQHDVAYSEATALFIISRQNNQK